MLLRLLVYWIVFFSFLRTHYKWHSKGIYFLNQMLTCMHFTVVRNSTLIFCTNHNRQFQDTMRHSVTNQSPGDLLHNAGPLHSLTLKILLKRQATVCDKDEFTKNSTNFYNDTVRHIQKRWKTTSKFQQYQRKSMKAIVTNVCDRM